MLAAAPALGSASLAGRIFSVVGARSAWTPADERGLAAAYRGLGPDAIVALPGGGFVFTDGSNNRVWRVDVDGHLAPIAGTGKGGFAGDGGPALSARLSYPQGLALLGDGSLLIADSGNRRVRRVAPDGVITTFAGNGERGSTGDGGLAQSAELDYPDLLAASADGTVLISDSSAYKVRRVAPDGTIGTVAGTGTSDDPAQSGPVADSPFGGVSGLTVLPDGGFAVSGYWGIRKVDASGQLSTVTSKIRGDALAALPNGALIVAEGSDVWRVAQDGKARLLAEGSDYRSPLSREGGPARRAGLSGELSAVAAMPDGGYLVGGDARVWRVMGGKPQQGLVVAVRSGRGRSRDGSYAARVLTSLAGRVRVRLYASRKSPAAAEVERRAPAGESSIALPTRGLTPGVYAVDAVVRSGSAVGRASDFVYVGGRLTAAFMKGLTDGTARIQGSAGSSGPVSHAADFIDESDATLCRAMSAKRFDCVWENYTNDEPTPPPGDTSGCSFIQAEILEGNGQIQTRSYACPRRGRSDFFKQRPHWSKGHDYENLADLWGNG